MLARIGVYILAQSCPAVTIWCRSSTHSHSMYSSTQSAVQSSPNIRSMVPCTAGCDSMAKEKGHTASLSASLKVFCARVHVIINGTHSSSFVRSGVCGGIIGTRSRIWRRISPRSASSTANASGLCRDAAVCTHPRTDTCPLDDDTDTECVAGFCTIAISDGQCLNSARLYSNENGFFV